MMIKFCRICCVGKLRENLKKSANILFKTTSKETDSLKIYQVGASDIMTLRSRNFEKML